LIVYLNNLEMQMSEKLSNYQKYFNLMKTLHFYLKIAITRQINAIVFRVELEKIVRLTKKIESISNHIKKTKKSNSFEDVKQYRFQSYNRIDRFDSDASQSAVQNNDRDDDRDWESYKRRDRENREDKFDNDTTRSQVECWNCERRDHYSKNCRKSSQNDRLHQNDQNNQDSRKVQNQST
jgi:predicted RND superfamily exporter protein